MGNCLSSSSDQEGTPKDHLLTVNKNNGDESKKKAGNGNQRLQNIFAAPVEVDSDFVPTTHSKSPTETRFIESALSDNFLFANLEKKELSKLIATFEKITVEGGQKIITQGETGDYFYLIEDGKVDFIVNGSKVGAAGPGKTFGELALIYNAPRAATCVAKSLCSLFRLDQQTFRQVLASNANKNEQDLKAVLRKVPFLADVEDTYLSKMARATTTSTFSTGETIIQKGDEGNVFYIIKQGKVEVRDIAIGGKTYENQQLGPDEYFGERAIVTNEPRVATIVALVDTQCFCLSREVFLEVVGPLASLVTKTADLRKLKSIPCFTKSNLQAFEYTALMRQIKDKQIKAGTVLFTEGTKHHGSLYFIRSGTVTITSSEGETQSLTTGSYFGEKYINSESSIPVATATATTDIVCGVLRVSTILSVIGDLSRINKNMQPTPSQMITTIKLQDLEKHKILGVGTFGKVWLVSNKRSKVKQAYALKIQRKRQLIGHNQVQGVLRETKIMSSLNHPFIIQLVSVFQDDASIMLLVKLVQGGELYSVLKNSPGERLPEASAKFYSAGILEGLSFMHRRSILYRDLKPENVLVDNEGYCVIVDLGFAKVVPDKTFTLCGTPWYIAPEVILGRGHDKAYDLWSWGVVTHELITGITPFNDSGTDQMTLFKAIVNGRSRILHGSMSKDASDLITRVLVTKPSLRLGCLAGGEADLKDHPWLKSINFDDLYSKKITAPWKPKIKDALDVSGFDNWDHMNVDEKDAPLTSKEQKLFAEFDELVDDF